MPYLKGVDDEFSNNSGSPHNEWQTTYYKEDIVKSCIKSCEKYALNPRLTNPVNKYMCLKNSYWIFANYFALVNNSLDFTEEQLDIIQKCHDNELPRSYAEDLYNKLLEMQTNQEVLNENIN